MRGSGQDTDSTQDRSIGLFLFAVLHRVSRDPRRAARPSRFSSFVCFSHPSGFGHAATPPPSAAHPSRRIAGPENRSYHDAADSNLMVRWFATTGPVRHRIERELFEQIGKELATEPHSLHRQASPRVPRNAGGIAGAFPRSAAPPAGVPVSTVSLTLSTSLPSLGALFHFGRRSIDTPMCFRMYSSTGTRSCAGTSLSAVSASARWIDNAS